MSTITQGQTMRKLLLIFLVVFISACSSNPRIENLTGLQRSKLSKIKVYESYTGKDYISLGTVAGLSCHRNAYNETTLTDREALEGIKIRAAILNADAVINTFCQRSSDVDWINNCYASIKCIGDAIQYK